MYVEARTYVRDFRLLYRNKLYFMPEAIVSSTCININIHCFCILLYKDMAAFLPFEFVEFHHEYSAGHRVSFP